MTKFPFLCGLALMLTTPAVADPLTILLVGANGMIGSRILAEASGRGDHVIATSRSPEKIANGPNITPEKLDATDRVAFAALARKADVIVIATSPRGGGDPIAEEKAVADAAIATAGATGKRLVVVGGAASLNTPDGRAVLDTMPPAMQKGEPAALRNFRDALKASTLDWTFFSPAMSIRPGVRTAKFRLGTSTVLSDDKGVSQISAEDYAVALVDELEKPAHHRQQMTIAY